MSVGTAYAYVYGTGDFYSGVAILEFNIVENPYDSYDDYDYDYEEDYRYGHWMKSGNKWWFEYTDGSYPANTMLDIEGSIYCFDSRGYMVTGWSNYDGLWRYYSSSGVMVTGWRQISGKWYYFEDSGAMAKSKWVGNYYLKDDGTMATNEWIGKYHVNDNGKWDKTK